MNKYKKQIDAIFAQKAAIEAGEISPSFRDRSTNARIEKELDALEMKLAGKNNKLVHLDPSHPDYDYSQGRYVKGGKSS